MTPKNVKGVKVTFIFLYIYIYKIKNKTAQTENNEEKKHILVKTPGAYINIVCHFTL